MDLNLKSEYNLFCQGWKYVQTMVGRNCWAYGDISHIVETKKLNERKHLPHSTSHGKKIISTPYISHHSWQIATLQTLQWENTVENEEMYLYFIIVNTIIKNLTKLFQWAFPVTFIGLIMKRVPGKESYHIGRRGELRPTWYTGSWKQFGLLNF